MKTDHAAVERVHPPRWVITHLVNPVARRVLRHDGRMADEILLLRFEGRRTGADYEIPISFRRIDGRIALFTEARWRHNFHDTREAEVTIHGEPREVRASLEDDPHAVATILARLIEELGRADAERLLGMRFHVDRKPTVDELAQMASTSGLSIVWIDEVHA